jgi:hypothetical protein
MSKSAYQKANPGLRSPKIQHIRHVKPEYFVHEGVNDMTVNARLAEIGTWTCCDKHGRFEWLPRMLRRMVMPYDNVDFESLMMEWVNHGFAERYEVDGKSYGRFFNWEKHQGINLREKQSCFEYPAPSHVSARASTVQAPIAHMQARVMSKEEGEVEGKREREGQEISASVAPRAAVVVNSKPKALSPSLDSSAESKTTTGGHEQTGEGAEIQALCFTLTGKTPKPEHVQALLAQYKAQEIRDALQWSVTSLANPDKDLQWVEKTFFQDGGAHGVILSARQLDWKGSLKFWSEHCDCPESEDELNQTLDDWIKEHPMPAGLQGTEVVYTLMNKAQRTRRQTVSEWKSQNPGCEKCEVRGYKLVGGWCPQCWEDEAAKPKSVEPVTTPASASVVESKPAPIEIGANMSEEEMLELFKQHGVGVKA